MPEVIPPVVAAYAHGDTVTVSIYKMDGTVVVSGAACSEIVSSGRFYYQPVFTPPIVKTSYLVVFTNATYEQTSDLILGGYDYPVPTGIVGNWTFGNDYTLVRDQIRSMIGDIISTDPLISDEAIAFFYLRAGNDLLGGALKAAKAAAAKLALEFDKNVDGLSTSRSQRHKAMLDVIASLEAEQAAGNFAFTIHTATGQVADVAGYPKEFTPTDLAAPTWEGDE